MTGDKISLPMTVDVPIRIRILMTNKLLFVVAMCIHRGRVSGDKMGWGAAMPTTLHVQPCYLIYRPFDLVHNLGCVRVCVLLPVQR